MEGQKRRQWNSSLPARKKPMKRSGFKPKNPKSSNFATGNTKRKTGLKAGKKTKEWDKVRAELKPLFEAAGITTCEARFPGCMFDNYLGFAHSKRRRNIKGDEIREVALLCQNCHEEADRGNEERSSAIIRGIISSRKTPVK